MKYQSFESLKHNIMKKTFFILALIASAFFANEAFSQGSDILTPPVGVGISYPYGDLHVHGTT